MEITIDSEWRVTGISQEAAAWFGGSPAQLIGADSRLRWPPTRELVEAVGTALAKGKASTVQYASLTAPGRWVEADVERRGGGARIRFRDITSQAPADDALRPPDDPRYAALGVGPTEVALLDGRGRIITVDAGWRALAATLEVRLPDAGVGAPYVSVCKAVQGETFDEVAFQRRLDETLQGRTSRFDATFSLKTLDGQELRQVLVAPLRMPGTTYFVAIHEDLSQRARLLAELRETSSQLLHAQEEERRRIAVELHDSTSQHIAGLILGLGQLRRRLDQDRGEQPLIDEMSEQAQQAMREIRVLSYLMNAWDRAHEGLATSARRFVEGFGRRTGLSATFEARGSLDDLSAAARHAVFRVIQEALTNVYRHARATQVVVSLVNNAGRLALRIADDGQGFGPAASGPADEPPLGVGIPGMRARIEQLGGTLDIESGGRGVVVTATLHEHSAAWAGGPPSAFAPNPPA